MYAHARTHAHTHACMHPRIAHPGAPPYSESAPRIDGMHNRSIGHRMNASKARLNAQQGLLYSGLISA